MTSISGQAGVVLRVFDQQGQTGTIILANGQLTGSSKGIQGIADAALRKTGGNPAEAMRWLDGWSNGYVWAQP